VQDADDARLREVVRAVDGASPGVAVHTDVLAVLNAPAGSTLIYVAREADLGALNMERPVFARKALRVILWNRPGLSAAMIRRSLDFYDWISDVVACPPAVPSFAVTGLRASLVARAHGVVWRGGPLDEVFRAAFPRRKLLRASVTDGFAALVDAVRAAGPDWIAVSGADSSERVAFVEAALADAGRRSRVVLDRAARCPPGWWSLHAVPLRIDAAARILRRAHAAGRLAALLDLEPEAVDLCADLLRCGIDAAEIDRALITAADPGAMLATLAVKRRLMAREAIVSGDAGAPPLLRAFAREIRGHRHTAPSRPPPASRNDRQAALQAEPMPILIQPTITAEGAVRVLIDEARELREQGYPAEAIRAAEGARDEARAIDRAELALVASVELGRARAALGNPGAALAAWAWTVAAARGQILSNPEARRALAEALAEIDTLRAAPQLPPSAGSASRPARRR